jgi:RNA polymerase sigma-70 factor (ECF subfamily)
MARMTPEIFGESLASAKAGDETAFTVLFRFAQPALLRYLRVISGNRSEDIAGETWVQVVRGLGSFEADEPAAFRAWVLSIGRHRWLDDQRARGRRPEVLTQEVPEQAAKSDVEAAVDDMMSTESALSLIARLPHDQAEVVTLRYIADLDVAATAAMLGKEPGAVRVLAHRGLRRLERLVHAKVGADQFP